MAQARLTASVALPSIPLRLTGTELPPEFTVLVFGAGVVAAAIVVAAVTADARR